ncbi:unnamed protein product [Trifolium pratense]|uniref:Uncharacterized protein n=1 Tax=Trifolium pratense TaxID=57577 RepID=A0ACB0LE80_TRIPR|nr:unnamed protein product [Trifolium pratense]
MGDKPATRADLEGFTADVTAALTALSAQITILSNCLNNNNAYYNTTNNVRRHHRDKGHVACKLAADKFEAKEHEVKECTKIDLFVENGHETNNIFTVKTTNRNTDLPEDESENHEVHKIGGDRELNSIKFVVDIEAGVTKKNGSYEHIVDTDTETLDDSQPSLPQKLNDRSDQTKLKEVKLVAEQDVSVEVDESKDEKKEIDERDDSEKNYVDEGNWSIVSMHTARSRITQGSFPIFRSLERVTKRRELYLKLEEKNQAFKEEKSRYETRLKEEQKVAIEQTRKNLVIKEKPILSFYYDKRMSQYQADEAPYQDENSGSSSFEVEETDVGGFLQYFIILVRFSFIIF